MSKGSPHAGKYIRRRIRQDHLPEHLSAVSAQRRCHVSISLRDLRDGSHAGDVDWREARHIQKHDLGAVPDAEPHDDDRIVGQRRKRTDEFDDRLHGGLDLVVHAAEQSERDCREYSQEEGGEKPEEAGAQMLQQCVAFVSGCTQVKQSCSDGADGGHDSGVIQRAGGRCDDPDEEDHPHRNTGDTEIPAVFLLFFCLCRHILATTYRCIIIYK